MLIGEIMIFKKNSVCIQYIHFYKDSKIFLKVLGRAKGHLRISGNHTSNELAQYPQ